MRKIFGLIFLISWVAGEAPRLFWKEFLPIRPMDAAAVLLVVMEWRGLIGNKIWRWAAAILLGSWVLGLRLFSLTEATDGLLYLIRTLVYLGLVINGVRLFAPVKKWIFWAMAAFVGLGFLQYIFLPDTRFLLQYGWDEHYYRLVGTVLDPNYFGVMAGMIGLYFIDKWINGQMDKWKLRLSVLLSLSALVLTYSRASYLSFITGVLVWITGRKLGFRLPVIVLLAALLSVGVYLSAPKPGGEGVSLWRTGSITQRLASWNEAIGVWKQHPWVGVGFNNYKVAQAARAPSSSWLLLVSTLGVVGMVGVTIRGIREMGEMRNRQFWLGILVMVGVHAVFNNTLFYPPVLGLLALLLSLMGAR